jgi:predicted NBD/HSP70 family sugar kinase
LAEAALPVKAPVLAENDANAFALGATYSQSKAQAGVTVFVVIESGVGGGIAINGRLFRGARGLAGEVGQLRMPGQDARNLEQSLGLGQALARYHASRKRMDLGLPDFLADVRDRAPDAIMIADDWAQALAFAVIQISCMIDPDRIVLGGAMAQLYPLVAARVAAHIRDQSDGNSPTLEIVLNEDATHGSAFGAACLMHQRFFLLESERLEKGRSPTGWGSHLDSFPDALTDDML